jgi:SNF2 family DNA or RNA helicase
MNKTQHLQLTYIPAKYWNKDISEFKLLSNKRKIPSDASFFLIWIPYKESVKYVEEIMVESFKEIPIDKLLSCSLNLAVPKHSDQNIIDKKFQFQKIYGKILPLLPASKFLNKLEIFEREDKNSQVYSGSIISWSLLTKLIFELLSRGSFVPDLEKISENYYNGHWRIILKDQFDYERFQTILRNCPWTAHNLPETLQIMKKSSKAEKKYIIRDLWHPSFVFSDYIDTMGDLLIRSLLRKSKFRSFEEFYNTEILKEKRREPNLSWDYKFLKSLIKKDKQFIIQQFHETIIPKLIKSWISIPKISTLGYSVRLVLQLDLPTDNQEKWPLNIFISLQNAQKLFSLRNILKGEIDVSSNIFKRLDSKEKLMELILRSLGKIMMIYPPIKSALDAQYFETLLLSSSEVMEFLSYPKDLLIQSGFKVILPEVFKSGGKQRLSARMVIYSEEKEEKKTSSSPIVPMFQISDMLNYKWEGELGNTQLDKEELEKIISAKQPLVKVKGEWILIEQQDLENINTIFESSGGSGEFSQPEGKINYTDALKLGLSKKVDFGTEGINYRVIVRGNFEHILEKIKKIEEFKKIPTPESFNGELRGYQKKGLTWMANLCEMNFGLCLADDMGLGKTIQVIALLLYFKEQYPESLNSVLIICPTSVLYNWQKEINKFGPELDVILHHGQERIKDLSEISKYGKPHRIILTTFGTIRNDVDLLKAIHFTGIIVDESQNMKNYETQQTQAIYQLQSRYKICLSGTPIENRLMELWTLFGFLNPGLLGDQKQFREKYVIPIERFHDPKATQKLKRIISPFILRRTKSDKSIIKDLPEKNEMKIYIDLSDTQFSLYKKVVGEALSKFENSQENKSMVILALLTKLKQICNHPYQFLHKQVSSKDLANNFNELISMSPKLERLLEMIDEVITKNEKAIIFTQFTKMGDIIEEVLNYRYNFPILYFHGSVPADKRKEIVETFQSEKKESPPLLILSLRAGGTGINLTEATTVFHYDRWWNPAVEKQATDRVYRIGQTECVNVYKFITLDTIEEKIDKLIEEKKELAEMVISSGESWISELNDEKIKELIKIERG